jgi:ABC-type nitrate/sulfonate/bicarbonate transport system substrate-binding protein
MMRKNLMLAACALLLMLTARPVYSAPLASSSAPLPITIGYKENIDWLLYVARDLKLFEKAGLMPTYVKFGSGAQMVVAMQSRKIDLASLGTVPFLHGLAQGLDSVMIGINPEGAYSEGIVARRGCGISAAGDLKGMKIGVMKGSTAHYGIIMALRQLGIRIDQVTLVDLQPAEQLEALKKNEIDAAMVSEPWMQRMVHEANSRIITTEGDLGIFTNVDVYSVQRDWLRENKETAVRFLEALLFAYDALQEDPSVGIRVLTEEIEITEEWAETIFQENPPPKIFLWNDLRYRYSLVKDSAFHRRLRFLSRFMFNEKLIREPVNVNKVMDASIINEALKRWKLHSVQQ